MTAVDTDWEPRLEPRLRVLFGLVTLLARVGLAPDAAKSAAKPAAQRQGQKPQRWQSLDARTDVAVSHTTIESRGGPLRIRVYTPPGIKPGDPAILYIHGGGFVFGGLDACHWICEELAGRSNTLIASVEYRLAPDDKFPAALEDCYDALQWLVCGGPTGAAPSSVAVAGDSAGGNLSAALCLLAREQGGPPIAYQSLIYPVLDSSISSESWRRCAVAGVDARTGIQMMELYAGDHDWKDPLVMPLHADDLSGLPPAHVVTADFDVLHDDGVAYAKRLQEAGVEVAYDNFAGMPHGFLSLSGLSRPGHAAVATIAGHIVDHLRP